MQNVPTAYYLNMNIVYKFTEILH